MRSLRINSIPRVDATLKAELQLDGGSVHQVVLEKVSGIGLSFCCDEPTSRKLMPSRQRSPGLLPSLPVVIRFSLPDSRNPMEFSCRLHFCRRRSQDCFLFECDFDGAADSLPRRRLLAFLQGGVTEEEIEPAEVEAA